MRLLLSCGLLWVSLSGAGLAAQTTVVEPPAPLLQTNDRLVAPDAGHAAPVDSDEAQAVLKEDGLRRSESRAVIAGGTQVGWVSAYEFQDATGAFAAYTYLREGGRLVAGAGRVNASEAELANGQTVFLSGVSVVRGQVKGTDAAALWKGVEIGLPKAGGRRGLAPLLPSFIPAAGLDAASVRYVVGPVEYKAMGGQLPAEILGWDKSVEVATASYRGRGMLTLLLYPTPQIAGDRLRAVEQAVNAAGGKNAFGTVVLRRVGPLVGVTTGAWTEAQAKERLGSLHLNEEISFDQKMPLEFHAEVQKTASLLENIAVFSGVLIVAAILLGLFLGGARAGIRKLQGKPVYSEPEFLTIDLREKPNVHFEKLGSHDEEPPAAV